MANNDGMLAAAMLRVGDVLHVWGRDHTVTDIQKENIEGEYSYIISLNNGVWKKAIVVSDDMQLYVVRRAK
jgi:hypothetical protein